MDNFHKSFSLNAKIIKKSVLSVHGHPKNEKTKRCEEIQGNYPNSFKKEFNYSRL